MGFSASGGRAKSLIWLPVWQVKIARPWSYFSDSLFLICDRRVGAARQAGVYVPCGWLADMRVLGNAVFLFTVIPLTVSARGSKAFRLPPPNDPVRWITVTAAPFVRSQFL